MPPCKPSPDPYLEPTRQFQISTPVGVETAERQRILRLAHHAGAALTSHAMHNRLYPTRYGIDATTRRCKALCVGGYLEVTADGWTVTPAGVRAAQL
jgi:hypothetical protein